MKSIPTIFVRDKVTRLVINKPSKLTDWVFSQKGVATRKYDGVAIKVENGNVFRRYEWKEGDSIPPGFVKLESLDPKRPNMSIPGWVPVPNTFLTSPQGKDEKALKEAWNAYVDEIISAEKARAVTSLAHNPYGPDYIAKKEVVPYGTYELCGPDIHGNHENLKSHILVPHGNEVLFGVPKSFEKLKKYLETFEGEGIVWHYQYSGNTLMAKIKRRDFGFFTRVTKEDIAMAYGKEKLNVDSSTSDTTCCSVACNT